VVNLADYCPEEIDTFAKKLADSCGLSNRYKAILSLASYRFWFHFKVLFTEIIVIAAETKTKLHSWMYRVVMEACHSDSVLNVVVMISTFFSLITTNCYFLLRSKQ